jgi:toxin-antitoxin system PIN domain toxin
VPYLADANVWVALSLLDHIHNAAARKWLDGVERFGSIVFCRPTQQAFLRLITTTAVTVPYGNRPLTNAEAWSAYEAFIADDRIAFENHEPDGIEWIWREYASRHTASPKLWMDAYLAAFARAGQHALVTTDAAYQQFKDLDLLLLGEAGSGREAHTGRV